MPNNWFKFSCLLLFSLILMSSPIDAHQKKEAITRVLFNERTSSIEIIHRFSIHDAEHAAIKLFGNTADIIANQATQQQFSNYVTESFTMKSLATSKTKDISVPLHLTTVGFEVDARFIWVYQETPIPTELNGFSIINNTLRDIWSEQVNLVNIERAKSVRSLVFKGSLEALKITF